MVSALRTRPRRRLVAPVAALAVAAVLAAAGCGGDSGGAEAGGAAGFVPAASPMYFEITTDLDGPQWTQLKELGALFPAFPELQRMIDEELRSDTVDFERDVRPLLGERAGVAALRVPGAEGLQGLQGSLTSPGGGAEAAARAAGDTGFVGVLELAEGADEDARALLARTGATRAGEHEGVEYLASDDRDGFAAVTDGHLLFADTEPNLIAALDAGRAGGDATLAGDDRFNDALGRLPDDVLAHAYLDLGAFFTEALAAAPQAEQLGSLADLRDAVMAASLLAEPEGVRLKGVVTGAPSLGSMGEFDPALTANVPADAVAYLGFSDLAGQVERIFRQLRESSDEETRRQIDAFVPQAQAFLGVSLDDLRALAEGEHALVLTEVVPRPGAALMLGVDDAGRAERTLDALRAGIPQALRTLSPDTRLPDWRPAQLAGGARGWQLPVGDGVSVTYGVEGEIAFLGTSPAAVRAVQRPVASLEALDAFRQATDGIPERVTSLLWLNAEEAVDAARRAGAFADAPPEALPNLRPVKGLAAWTTGGDTPEFEVFVRMAG